MTMRSSLWILLLTLLSTQVCARVTNGDAELRLQFQNATARHGRILGGTAVSADNFPLYNYHVLVKGTGASGIAETFCGGALLTKNYVITAAHCVASGGSASVYVGKQEDPMTGNPFQGVPIIHPGFKYNYVVNNIALIRLIKAVTISGTVGTIRLSSVHPSTLNNIVVKTMGFGPADETTVLPTPPVLNVIEMTHLYGPTCKSDTIDVYVDYPPETGCLSTESGAKGVCFGDGGGPVVYPSATDNSPKLLAINSQYLACSSQYPSSITYIFPFIGWIQTTVRLVLT
ncbi:brachyurin-like [Cloeon dipterum]|uniref:brachyurin-like n=1 Tax=Cloeon dipterum TaxID=197152 RepID=UPI0032200E9A